MENRYDIVVIGGGPNGLGIACYLAKSGLSVCVVEDRSELGGGLENAEPMPGFRIDPHATYFYGGAAPFLEQMELHKFGFRMNHYRAMAGAVTSEGKALTFGRYAGRHAIDNLARFSKKDSQLWELFELSMIENAVDVLRSVYWTPPPPEGYVYERSELPFVKAMKKAIPFIFDESWVDMSMFELLDTMVDTEALKVLLGMSAWYNGPHPAWKGMGLFALTCNQLAHYTSGSPVGGMHGLTHAVTRCALKHGVRIFTNSRVEQILVKDGEARGVVLASDALAKNNTIWADKAVISGVHVHDTFLNLVESCHLEADFRQRVGDINLKGGSLYVLSLITTELPKFIGEAPEVFENGFPSCIFLPADSRETVLNQTRDVYSLNTHPTSADSMIIPLCIHDIYDRNRCPSGYHVISPIYLQMPPPEYHVDGPEAVNHAAEEITGLIMETIRKVAPNLTDDKIVAKFVNTPYDSSLRNLGFVGGNWYGVRCGEDEWNEKRPLPELSRYRSPIKNLYLCNQSSYPGGLALFAVPYNLMHILIEDLKLEPGSWWYPSPHYVPEGECHE